MKGNKNGIEKRSRNIILLKIYRSEHIPRPLRSKRNKKYLTKSVEDGFSKKDRDRYRFTESFTECIRDLG